MLAYPNLRWYVAANACSNIGTWLQNTAQILLAYRLTNSVTGVGLVTVAQFGTSLVLDPWSGALANRFDRRKVLIGTQSVSALIALAMAGLPDSGLLTLAPLVCDRGVCTRTGNVDGRRVGGVVSLLATATALYLKVPARRSRRDGRIHQLRRRGVSRTGSSTLDS